LVVTGGVAGAVAVIGAVLAAVGVFGWCVLLFRRTVGT
jgi:hypothetical protein